MTIGTIVGVIIGVTLYTLGIRLMIEEAIERHEQKKRIN